MRVSKVVKRDGRIVDFDSSRIENAIKKAMFSTGMYNREVLRKVVDFVLKIISQKYDEKNIPHVEDIQDIVEFALVKFDLYEVAKAYILYRKERERIREEKKRILEKDYVDEVDKAFSINALRLLASRYLLKDENGKLIETPKQLFQRVAGLVVIPDILHDPRVFSKEGGLKTHLNEEFNPVEWVGKLGLGLKPDGFEYTWNEWHLERMKKLYDELNSQGKTKIPWSSFLEMLSKGEFDEYYANFMEYYSMMVEKRFLPNSPTLFNAGTKIGQLSACFVLDIEDDMESIMKAARDCALIFKSGGGVGINYSKLRPEGDIVSSTMGIASGPVSFMKIIDTVTEVVKQGGKRRGANMGILEINHPDIEKFISAKTKEGMLENFNLSVMIPKDFWSYYQSNKQYPLINPRDKSVWKHVDPKRLFEMVAETAWKTGDPGVLFQENINKRNILRKAKGEIKSTNPCGEEPLYPYESCNLGSINLYAFVKGEESRFFDWSGFEKTVRLALRFLDNVIDVNKFPLKKIESETKKTRKVGLGLMGLADTLFALKIPYNSEEGFEFMRRVAEHLTYYAMDESVEVAKERGSFPLFSESSYIDGEMPIEGFYHRDWWTLDWSKLSEKIRKHGIRNAEVTTIAPTGSISMIADVSSGIEPQFALIYEKRVTLGTFYYIDLEFERQLREKRLYNGRILKKVADNGGSIQGLSELPEEMRKLFLVAYDIPWWDHVRAQAELNKWICAAVSKTINMPNWVSPKDVEKAFIFAWKLGLKGITIYRDGSKTIQVLVTPSQREGRYVHVTENKTLELMKEIGLEPPAIEEPIKVFIPKVSMPELEKPIKKIPVSEEVEICPVCGSKKLIYEESCVKCLDCGWVACVAA